MPLRPRHLLEPLLLALLLPVILTITPRTLPVLILLPFPSLLRRITQGHFIPATPFNATLLLLLLTIYLNLSATVDIALSMPHIAGAAFGFALFVAVVAFARRSTRHFHFALAAYIALGLALAAAALFTTQWKSEIPLVSAIPQYLPASLNLINPNYLAGALLLITPVPLTLASAYLTYAKSFIRETGRFRSRAILALLLLSSFFFLILLLLSQSRSGFAGLAFAFAFIILVLLRRRPRLLILLFLLATIVVVLALILLPPDIWVRIAGLTTPTNLVDPANGGATAANLGLDSRIEIWQRAIYGIQDFPLTGMGMNTFDSVVRLLYPLYIAGPDSPINHAHNHLLQTAVDLGIPGLIAYLGLWFVAAATLRRAWHNTTDPWRRAITLGFAAALFAYFIYGITEAIALGGRPAFIFWYLLALIAAHPQQKMPGTSKSARHLPVSNL